MQLTTTGLVVVDVQNGFARGPATDVVPAIVDLVARWQAAGGKTLYTRYLNYPDSPFERIMGWTQLRDSPEIDLVDELTPYLGDQLVIDKTIYSLFTDEGARIVEALGWTDLIICGLTTESCVCKTAVDAFERDLTPWVVTDACGSHAGQEAHDAGLLVISRFIGPNQLVTARTVLDEVARPPA
jgi:nicotinamidase-related amidase